jgi:hypothetical protein
MCKIYTTRHPYNPQFGVALLKRHMLTKIHKGNKQSPSLQRNLFNISNEELKIATEFDIALLKAFCEAQIPLYKLEISNFRFF